MRHHRQPPASEPIAPVVIPQPRSWHWYPAPAGFEGIPHDVPLLVWNKHGPNVSTYLGRLWRADMGRYVKEPTHVAGWSEGDWLRITGPG